MADAHLANEDGISSDLITRDRDTFLRELLRDLAGTLEDVVGIEEAEGFVSIVGARMGERMNTEYCQAMGVERLTREQVAEVLVDLKRRIDGGFTVESISEDAIVLTNDCCPFGAYVVGRPSLCMMTSNVFGRITADNLGFAQVNIDQAIALGDAGCRVVVSLKPGAQGHAVEGRSYFRV